MFAPSMSQLRGLPLATAQKFGMPHVGCAYLRDDADSHRLIEGAACCVCGAPASNAHHDPPKGMGGRNRSFLLRTPAGAFVLKPALLALCGSGTTGCHGGFHGGARFRAEWVWASDGHAERWWSGYWLSHGIEPHSASLYELGRWTICDLLTGETVPIGGDAM